MMKTTLNHLKKIWLYNINQLRDQWYAVVVLTPFISFMLSKL